MQSRTLKKLNKLLLKVRTAEAQYKDITNEELQNLTNVFRERYNNGESLDSMLPEAFAAISEADYRILGMRPYDVQVLGAIALFKGYLAEMNTGEGKSLTATMPMYLNGLTGKSTILLTTNDYLALRDSKEMGEVYSFMGLTVGCGSSLPGAEPLTNDEKREIYNKDIVYATGGALGFDYLINNLVKKSEDRFMREFDFIIVDEADEVLLDSAQTPLVISGVPRVQSNLYEICDFFITTLVEDDYKLEKNAVWLTAGGVKKAERFFRIDNFYAREHFEINRHVILALRAHYLFEKDEQYVVSEKGEIILLNAASGRATSGTKLGGGIHQALETKEGLKNTQETRSMAIVTFQNLFLMAPKLAGMSGTIQDAKRELMNIYGKEIVVIPSNKPVIRKDYADKFYMTKDSMISAVVEVVEEKHHSGQPVLVVASTIAETEEIGDRLSAKGIPHSVLNANNDFWEAEIVAEAGQRGSVTVATSMVGRGTDIKLGHGVDSLGGLCVIGVGRMENNRLERQARGRAGRQGDPGESRFFVSLEDNVVYNRLEEYVDKKLDAGKELSQRKIKRLANKSQKRTEEAAALGRKRSTQYDQIIQKQREIIYATRDSLMVGGTLPEEKFIDIAKINIREFIKQLGKVDEYELSRYILDNISYTLDCNVAEICKNSKKDIEEYLINYISDIWSKKKQALGSASLVDDYKRHCFLSSVDDAWVEEVDYLQQLSAAVSGRSFAQRDPYQEYEKEGFESFTAMKTDIYRNTMRNILLGDVVINDEGRMIITFP